MKNVIEILKTNLNIINAFIITTDNDKFNIIWNIHCDKCTFNLNHSGIKNENELQISMFNSYTFFIEQLPIHLKLEYISFYEHQLCRPWKQLYLDSVQPPIYKTDADYVNVYWYIDSIKDLRL